MVYHLLIKTAAGAPRRGQPKAVEKIFFRKSWTAVAFIVFGGMGASAPIVIINPILVLPIQNCNEPSFSTHRNDEKLFSCHSRFVWGGRAVYFGFCTGPAVITDYRRKNAHFLNRQDLPGSKVHRPTPTTPSCFSKFFYQFL
jgi:hypothetical protein